MPKVDCEGLHPVLRVTNVREAIEFYTTRLGFTLGFIWPDPSTPTYAGVNLGDVRVYLDECEADGTGFEICFDVGNADELFEAQRANGVKVLAEPADRPYGIRDYSVEDPWGYRLTFGQYIYNTGEPIEIERVDVPVRLEKRLAALLIDLAAYKHMSLSSCLEEILLHTNEPLGDGVASPHTPSQLRYIQQLKAKHGIDYDSHGSYRFVEE